MDCFLRIGVRDRQVGKAGTIPPPFVKANCFFGVLQERRFGRSSRIPWEYEQVTLVKFQLLVNVQPEMILEGVVTNVTKFGAFVDIGVHQDGLVHISELSNRFIKDPSEAVKAGQIVKVKVLSADAKTKRIALSMRALMGPTPKNSRPNSLQPVPKPHPSLSEKLAMLSTKWRVS